MPDLATKTTATRVDLPSGTPDDPAWVELKNKLTLGDFVEVQKAEGEFEQGIILATRLITDWSFTLNGEKAPITPDVLQLLDSADFVALSVWIKDNIKIDEAAVSNDQKKSFSSTLATPSTDSTPAPTGSPTTSIPIN